MTKKLDEIGFRDVVDFPDYRVSSCGVVMTKTRLDRAGKTRKERELVKTLRYDGYTSVVLRNDEKTKACLVHRVVAEAWLPNPSNLPEVDHIDSVRNNCHVDNLQWISKKDNARKQAVVKGNIPYKGVSKTSSSKTYVARIKDDNGKTINLCGFLTPEEAASAYDRIAVEIYGQYAMTNQMIFERKRNDY